MAFLYKATLEGWVSTGVVVVVNNSVLRYQPFSIFSHVYVMRLQALPLCIVHYSDNAALWAWSRPRRRREARLVACLTSIEYPRRHAKIYWLIKAAFRLLDLLALCYRSTGTTFFLFYPLSCFIPSPPSPPLVSSSKSRIQELFYDKQSAVCVFAADISSLMTANWLTTHFNIASIICIQSICLLMPSSSSIQLDESVREQQLSQNVQCQPLLRCHQRRIVKKSRVSQMDARWSARFRCGYNYSSVHRRLTNGTSTSSSRLHYDIQLLLFDILFTSQS